MKLFSRAVVAIVWCAAIAGGSHAAQSQLPTRPVRLLVPSPPGGPSDFAGRLIAPGLSEALGQNVVVDARQSVNGILSMETAARAAPDGSTLAIGNSGTHVMNVGLYRRLPYDPIRDFVPVSQLISAGTALVANPKIGPNSFKEFIAAAKRDPGKFNIAIAGANGHVATEVLKVAIGINLNNVPYKGSAPSEIAVMSGEVDVALLSIPIITQYVKAGRMKVFGVTTASRSSLLPDAPTIAESGVEGYEFGNWHGLFAPAGTPDRFVRMLHKEVVRIFAKQEIRDLVIARGSEIIAGTPEELAAKLKRDIPKYRKIMAEAGIQSQ
ncbi:MAG TPA: tripartite tricarboxylate transporter substrate binding protein [Burkholderiales bacterium]|nr:tripartite tricarboxylate transporter substrate binding protein [Burkholderiales bacterium]